MDVISCQGLTKRFGPAIVVNGLDLTVSSGQVYGFLGPNGAGKTTTIRMLLGLIAPSAGEVYLLGRRLPDPRVVAQAGSMIEEPSFYSWMTGQVNLEVLGATGVAAAPARSPGCLAWSAWPMLPPGRSRLTRKECASGSG